MSTPVKKCDAPNGRLQMACDALHDNASQNNSKKQGMYIAAMRNLDTNAVRLSVFVRVTGQEPIAFNYCPYCGTVIEPSIYARLQQVAQ